MSDQNIYISNGTCYSAAGKKLDGSFVPCGNDAFGHQTCCGAGDNCLADNACFGIHGSGYGSYLTYMAGCSDPDYKDASCPDKEGIDQPWIALTLCDNSDGVWAACSQEGNPTTLQPGSFCSCTDTASATVAFSDANSLTNICSLPESTGDSIQYFAGHIPTSPSSAKTTTAAGSSDTTTARSSGSTATATQTGATTSTQSDTNTSNSGTATPGAGSSGTSVTATITGTNSASPSATGTAAADSDTSSGTSSGTKIGIGVGVALGVLLLLAIIAAFLIRRRKRRRSPSEVEKGRVNGAKLSKPDPADPHRVSALSATPRASEADGQAISEADGKAVSKADKLAMAEADGHALLEADGKAVSKADKLPISEADGQAVSEVDGRAARPWSMRSELEGTEVIPNMAEHPGGASGVGNAHGGRVRRSGELSPVAELPGSSSWQNDSRGSARGGQTPASMGDNREQPPHVGGLSIASPGASQLSSEQGAGYRPAQGRSRWGEKWRVR